MFEKAILICFLVYYAMASSAFFKNNDHRAELFKLTDNEMAIFKINLPEGELQKLKEVAQVDDLFFLSKSDPPEFKTKNASMIVEIKGEKNAFNDITFSLGGSSTRAYGKLGYNIKIRGGEDLFGRTQIKLRPDVKDATTLRSKLACDIHNRLGLPSISANYAVLYINEEYYGFYILMDNIKLSWTKAEFNDPETTTLYKCKYMGNDLSLNKSKTGCVNENDKVNNHTEWITLLSRLDEAKFPEEIEDIFDIDQFLTEIAFEYLSGSWDHYNKLGHNFNMYKPSNETRWKYILNDFDSDIGQGIVSIYSYQSGMNTDFPNYSFKEYHNSRHLYDILIFKNSTRFDNIVRKVVTEVYNPTVLFPHIDELKEFIRSYVELDKTPNENGNLPGRINNQINLEDKYSFAEWDANSEFTSVRSSDGLNYGLKYWILEKYRHVCKEYNITCDPYYIDENYSYSIDEKINVAIEDLDFVSNPTPVSKPEEPTATSSKPEEPTATSSKPEEPSTTSSKPEEPSATPSKPKNKCMSELIGYECCSSDNTIVYDHDSYGDWGYDINKKVWCGLTPYTESSKDEECWSEVYGYSCCKGCGIFTTDEFGSWGYENQEWCGIQSFC